MAKSLLLSLLIFCTIGLSAAFAKIWRVNNNAGIQADFTTLQAAHNGAAAGDTLYLEGSTTDYGGLTCTKKLSIIGPGYYLTENNIANINSGSAKVSAIQMNAGAQGSEIMGLDFNGNQLTLNTSDIIVKRNKFNFSNGNNTPAEILYNTGVVYLGNGNANNIFIIQNFGLQIVGQSYPNSGILIMNNLVAYHSSYGENYSGTCLILHQGTNAIVQNNIFLRGTVTAYTANFTNNIMVNGFFEKRNNLTANNIGNGTQFGTADGNQSNVNMSTVFEGTGSPDARWMLKAGSPAKGAGFGSTAANPADAGMFWGTTAYKISGLPGLPVIYFIQVQPVGSNSDPIDVTVKVKSTN